MIIPHLLDIITAHDSRFIINRQGFWTLLSYLLASLATRATLATSYLSQNTSWAPQPGAGNPSQSKEKCNLFSDKLFLGPHLATNPGWHGRVRWFERHWQSTTLYPLKIHGLRSIRSISKGNRNGLRYPTRPYLAALFGKEPRWPCLCQASGPRLPQPAHGTTERRVCSVSRCMGKCHSYLDIPWLSSLDMSSPASLHEYDVLEAVQWYQSEGQQKRFCDPMLHSVDDLFISALDTRQRTSSSKTCDSSMTLIDVDILSIVHP